MIGHRVVDGTSQQVQQVAAATRHLLNGPFYFNCNAVEGDAGIVDGDTASRPLDYGAVSRVQVVVHGPALNALACL
ncbi:hypothetical protein D3C72_2351660 [compost metagenome]